MLDQFKEKHSVKIGLAGTRRNISSKNFFNKDIARQEKDIVESMLKNKKIEFVNLDFLNEEGLIYKGIDADKVAKNFINAEVDAVFAPHCNFGTEDAIARIAKKVNKPLLLWGPRDDAPLADGNRMRDSQCGLFATSKVLQQFGVPFSYIPNSRIGDPVFEKGFQNFVSASAIVKAFKGARIGQIGTRPGAFWTVKYNEEELLQRFGIEIIPISVPELKMMMDSILKNQYRKVKEVRADIQARVQKVCISVEALDTVAAMKIAILQWADAEGLTGAAMLCNNSVRDLLGVSTCFTMADLTDDGFPVACETDIHGAVSSLMAQAARQGSTATFLADMTIRHPKNDNAELLWHCGVFPHSLKKEGCISVLNNHYGADVPGVAEWEIKGGNITITRFDGVNGDYRLLMAEGHGVSGPRNKGTYLWVEFENWVKLETRLIKGPYIHHCTGIHGNVAASLYEACRYIPGLKADPVNPTEEELETMLER